MCKKMKDTLILNDGSVIELETGASLSSLSVLSESKTAMVETWDKLTDENLSAVQIKNGDGVVVANYTNLAFISETSTVNSDGSVLTTFKLREKTQTEIELEELQESVAELNEDMSAIDEALGGE